MGNAATESSNISNEVNYLIKEKIEEIKIEKNVTKFNAERENLKFLSRNYYKQIYEEQPESDILLIQSRYFIKSLNGPSLTINDIKTLTQYGITLRIPKTISRKYVEIFGFFPNENRIYFHLGYYISAIYGFDLETIESSKELNSSILGPNLKLKIKKVYIIKELIQNRLNFHLKSFIIQLNLIMEHL